MNSITKSKTKEDNANWLSQLGTSLVSATIFKPSQGRVVRQVTFFALAILFALLAWEIGKHTPTEGAKWISFGLVTALGAWISFRVINIPLFADFLIATEAEMRKVTWPTRQELIRGSVVVMFLILGLAVAMFGFDLLWATIFRLIRLR